MSENLPETRADRVGRAAAHVGLGLAGVDSAWAVVEATSGRPATAALLAGVGAAALAVSVYFYRESGPGPAPDQAETYEDNFFWAEGIGWVSQEPYDPDGPHA